MVLIGSLLALVVLWGIHHTYQKQLADMILQRAELVANMVNYAAESIQHRGELQRIITSIGADQDIIDIHVVGGEPLRVLASTKNGFINKYLSSLSLKETADALNKSIATRSTYSHHDVPDQIFTFTSPLLLSQVELTDNTISAGAVLINLDTRPMQETVRLSTVQFSSAFILTLAVLVTFGYRLLNRLVIKPIDRIGRLVEQNAEGNSNEWNEIPVTDEIGLLADTLRSSKIHSEAVLQALEASEFRWKFAIEGSGEGLWDWDMTNNSIFFSRRWKEMLGYGDTELSGTLDTWEKLLHPDDREATFATISNYLANIIPIYHCEFRLKCKDGNWKWILARGMVVNSNKDGQPLRMIGTHNDISESKAAEAALQDEAEHTRAIVNNMVDGVITIGTDGIIKSINPAASQIFGYAPEELMGRNIKVLMLEPDRSSHDEYVRNSRLSHSSRVIGINRELTGLRKDGSEFTMELSVAEISRQGNRLYVGLVRDITERNRIDRMKSEFVSTVSHELRTPLTSINAAISMITAGTFGPLSLQAQQMIEIAQRNCQRLTFLINDLLDMEKLVAGKMSFDMQPHKLMPLIEQALAANRTFGLERKINLSLKNKVPDAMVEVDSQRLMQVMSNLLSNAIKYSKEKDTVEISVEMMKSAVRVSVIDHGPGIPEEFRKRIFQKFAQADSSDSRQKGGTGLGLAICRELINHMNGRIGYESAISKGSTFYFDLPIWMPPRAKARSQ